MKIISSRKAVLFWVPPLKSWDRPLKKLGPAAKKVIPASLIKQSEKLPAIGLKRFVQHNQQGFLVHVYIEDWPDGIGATVNIHTYGPTTIKLSEPYPTFHIDLAAGRFLNKKDTPPLFNPSPIVYAL